MSDTLFAQAEADPPEMPGLKHAQVPVYAALRRAAGASWAWMTDGEIQAQVHFETGTYYGIGSIGARRREVNAALRGTGWTIADRRRKGHRGWWEFRLQRQGGDGKEYGA